MYIDFSQENWEKWLLLTKFATNNTVFAFTDMSPFFANHGFHPRMNFGPPRVIPSSFSRHLKKSNKDRVEFVNKIEKILEVLCTNLTNAQITQKKQSQTNKSPAPFYKIGDEIFLDSRNITITRPIKKLNIKFFGPFKVLEKVNLHAYKFELPVEMSFIHPIFHTNLFRPAPSNPIPGQKNASQELVDIDANGYKLWSIEAITDSRKRGKWFEYEILWKGYKEKTWKPLKNVVNARKFIIEFEKKFPDKKKPTAKDIKIAKTTATKTEGQEEQDS